MKTAISIPDPIFSRVERFARRRKMSRSALFAAAVSEYLEQHGEEDVTERLNEIYSKENSILDPVLMDLQTLSLTEEQW
jgi:metal-responsive CopG/Arc/MetJ family transcriptional regulator